MNGRGSRGLRVLQVVPSFLLGGAEHVGSYLAWAFANDGVVSACAITDGPLRRWLGEKGVQCRVFRGERRRWRELLAGVPLLCWFREGLRRRRGGGQGKGAVLAPVWGSSLRAGCAGWLRSLLDGFAYDVVHVHSVYCAGLIPCAREHTKRVIFGQHNVLSERHEREDIDFLMRHLPAVDAVVCPSQASRSDFVATTGYPPERTAVIPNPSFLATGERKTLDRIRCIGTASNLGAAKDVGVLLQAYGELRRRGLELELRIAGGGPQAVARWRREARRLGLQPPPRFLGRLDTEREMGQFYEAIDLLVLPSRTEGFPVVIVEAMSRGIPVVASDIPALREVLGGAGVLFRTGDPSALAVAIQALASDSSVLLRMRNAGFQRWEQLYKNERIVEAYDTLYRGRVSQ